MAWIELHQSVWEHRKTFTLAVELKLKRLYAAAHLIHLWTWALDNVPDGDLSNIPQKAIAFGALWERDPHVFLEALIKSGWVDRDEQGIRLHDWYDYAGRLIENRKANAERMKKSRARNVQNTCAARAGATVPNLTVPNHTIPKKKNTPPISPPPADKPAKEKYAEYVTLTSDEHAKLITEFGEQKTADMIERMNLYKGSTGKKYKSDYMTTLGWDRQDKAKEKEKAAAKMDRPPTPGKSPPKDKYEDVYET